METHDPAYEERLFTSEEAADLFGVSAPQFLIWWMRGEVPFRRLRTKAGDRFVLHDPGRVRPAQPATIAASPPLPGAEPQVKRPLRSRD